MSLMGTQQTISSENGHRLLTVDQVETTLGLRWRILRRPLLSDEHSRVASAVILTIGNS